MYQRSQLWKVLEIQQQRKVSEMFLSCFMAMSPSSKNRKSDWQCEVWVLFLQDIYITWQWKPSKISKSLFWLFHENLNCVNIAFYNASITSVPVLPVSFLKTFWDFSFTHCFVFFFFLSFLFFFFEGWGWGYTYIHTYRHIDIHTYRHTYIHTYIHAYIHTYIQICMHIHGVLQKSTTKFEGQYPTFSLNKNHPVCTNDCKFDNYQLFPLMTFFWENYWTLLTIG